MHPFRFIPTLALASLLNVAYAQSAAPLPAAGQLSMRVAVQNLASGRAGSLELPLAVEAK